MKVNFPKPTVTFSTAELCDAVRDYLIKYGHIQGRGTLGDYQMGNLISAEFYPTKFTGSNQDYLAGDITFELLPESKS